MKFASVVALATLVSISAYADDVAQRVDASRAVIKEFAGTLQNELQTAMKSGGPSAAIEVCNKRAPGIASEMSKSKGWDVGRTGLKIRNAANVPDAWEKGVLEKFEARKAAGEEVAKMEYSEVVEANGKKQFRYMKAIPVGAPCLTCHGEAIDPKIQAKLKEKYPDDKAVGYKLGDIRGAFTITQPM